MEKYFINKHDKPLINDYWDDNITDCSLFKKLNIIDNNTEELNNNGLGRINKDNKPNIDLRKNRNRRRGPTIRNNKKKSLIPICYYQKELTHVENQKIKCNFCTRNGIYKDNINIYCWIHAQNTN